MPTTLECVPEGEHDHINFSGCLHIILLIPCYLEFRRHFFLTFIHTWKLGRILNSRHYFSLSESLENLIFLEEGVALLKRVSNFTDSELY
jgi:hypothetical protein